jgi:hypothetical protein
MYHKPFQDDRIDPLANEKQARNLGKRTRTQYRSRWRKPRSRHFYDELVANS